MLLYRRTKHLALEIQPNELNIQEWVKSISSEPSQVNHFNFYMPDIVNQKFSSYEPSALEQYGATAKDFSFYWTLSAIYPLEKNSGLCI